MPLKDLLSRERIAVLDEPLDRDAVLDAAARLLALDTGDGAAAIAECLRQRERLGSTAIGHGVAIPHGRCSEFAGARAAFLRLGRSTDFDAGDGEPVDLVFAMAVPQHFTQQHLELLAELAEYFADPDFRDALRQAGDADALSAVLLRGRAA
jgi:PTS system nitrogen regulatory IIA component